MANLKAKMSTGTLKGKSSGIPALDKTLTTEGKAADAKAVGERIAQERQTTTKDIGNLETKLSQDYRIVEVSGVEIKEWFNPPMTPNIEYRLAERFLGKPVYVKAFSETFDETSLPKCEFLIGDLNIESIIGYDGCFYAPTTGAALAFPFSAKGNNFYSNIYISHNTIAVVTAKHDQDLPIQKEVLYSGYRVWIKYTKTTD